MSLVQVTKSTATAVDLLYRDTNLPGSSQTFTVVFNHLANAGSVSFGSMGLRAATAENAGAFIGCYITSAGIYRLNSATGASYLNYGENAIVTDTTNAIWVAIVSDATNIRSFYKLPSGALTAGPTRTALSFTPARMMCAQGSNSAIGKRGAFGFYNAALDVGEISRIFLQRGPAIHRSLLFWNSCLGSTMHGDQSGTGGDLTQGTDLAQSSVAGDPLIPWRLRAYSFIESIPAVGFGDIESVAAVLSGKGGSVSTGKGGFVGSVAVLSGKGTSLSSGKGGFASAAAVLGGVGIGDETATGSGGAVSPAGVLSGKGGSVSTGNGGAGSKAATLAGKGSSVSEGSGGAVSPAGVLGGKGSVVAVGKGGFVGAAASLRGFESLSLATNLGLARGRLRGRRRP